MSEPLYPPPPPIVPPPTGPGAALPQVQGPAIGLLVTAIIGAVWNLFGLVSNVLGTGLAGLESMGGDQAERYIRYMGGGAGILWSIVGLAVSGFVLWAALQMKQLRGWTLAMVASIISMIPCLGPCCLVGLPMGIWSLVVLLKPEVKAAFRG